MPRRNSAAAANQWMRPLAASVAEALLVAPAACRNPASELRARGGAKVRRAQRASQAAHGRTPLKWLRECRPDLARAKLLAVAEPYSAAKRAPLSPRHWDFGHSAAFRARFGELPSETVGRCLLRHAHEPIPRQKGRGP